MRQRIDDEFEEWLPKYLRYMPSFRASDVPGELRYNDPAVHKLFEIWSAGYKAGMEDGTNWGR